jgi:hypothetical protein
MVFKVPKRHILRPTLSSDMVQRVLQWERQKNVLWKKKARAHDKEILLYIVFMKKKTLGKRRRKEEKTKEWSNLNFFSKLSFLDMYQKYQHIHILMYDHSSWFTFSLHQVRGPKAL